MNENLIIILSIYEFLVRVLPSEKNWSIIDFAHYVLKNWVPNKSTFNGVNHDSNSRMPL
jgi:hypothetical protein